MASFQAASAAPLEPGTFFGTNRRTCRGSDFILTETLYPARMRVPRHVHELAYFGFLIDGGYWERFRSGRIDFSPLSVVFQLGHEVRCGDISARGARLLHLEIQRPWLERLRELGRVPEDALAARGGPLARLAAQLYREFRTADAASALSVEGLALEMLAALVRGGRAEARPPAWLVRAAERLRDEPTRAPGLAELAREVDVNPVRLARAFRRHYGQSAGEFARRARVSLACRRLADPAVGLAEVALEAGFADQSHFTRVFRRLTGQTPGAYRRAAGGRS